MPKKYEANLIRVNFDANSLREGVEIKRNLIVVERIATGRKKEERNGKNSKVEEG